MSLSHDLEDSWFKNELLKNEILELKKKIDRMKCCKNCEFSQADAFIDCPLDIRLCNGRWKLKGEK